MCLVTAGAAGDGCEIFNHPFALAEVRILIQERVFARVFTGLRTVADARCFGHSTFAPRRAELRCFAAKNPQAVENDRRKCVRLWNTSQSGEVAGRLLSTEPVLQRTQDSGQLSQ
jgi:hypothetical protein